MPTPWVSRVDKVFTKSVTFTGAANLGATGTVPIATVAGACLITLGAVRCLTTDLVSSGGTISLGTANNVDGLIPATLASTIDANDFWHDASPLVKIAPAIVNQVVCADIILTVAVANITAGILEFVFYYRSASIATPGTMT